MQFGIEWESNPQPVSGALPQQLPIQRMAKSMRVRAIVVACLLVAICNVACADIVYQLDRHFDRLANNYGFGVSGSITTDGTLGVLTNLDFVKDWAINVATPFAVDGIASDILTPANSTIRLAIGNSAGLLVTAESIIFASPVANSSDMVNELIWATLQNETV